MSVPDGWSELSKRSLTQREWAAVSEAIEFRLAGAGELEDSVDAQALKTAQRKAWERLR